jgi:hypothetical protein
MRQVTWYQFSSSDLRSIGVAHVVTTLFAAAGTFALSNHLEFNKDITLALQNNQNVPLLLQGISDLLFWVWVFCWVCAAVSFIWQRNELQRIKEEHGEVMLWKQLWINLTNLWAKQ